jgi:beta-galactosidase
MLIQNGGPIIAVQLENEYGAFADDRAYLEGLRASYRRAGLGNGLLFTSNQASDLTKGSLPDLPSVVNFGSGNASNALPKLIAFRPDGPRMVGEYWAGWFDKWGEDHHQTDGHKEAEEVGAMLRRGYSVSLYMVHGGTSFGWMNGADSHTGTDYHPDTTSYDYDAPLDESGNPRYKYALLAHAIAAATGSVAPPVPAATRRTLFPLSPMRRSASLWHNLPKPQAFTTPPTFEDVGLNYGYMLYRLALPAGAGGALTLKGVHDYAQVYVDRALIGTLDRRTGDDTVQLPRQPHAATLDILVENTGRVNYSTAIRGERAGLTGAATLDGAPLTSWQVFPLPMDDLARLRLQPGPCSGPCFYETTMDVARPADTYLDTRGLHKGQLWLGTHNLGRFWSIGPSFTLYAPGPWMQRGSNRIVVFDLLGDGAERLTTVADPVYARVTQARDKQ